ncbi:hypothetical protein [Amycolatopsis taiwanensis]|uniref:hypothetical protein n=1 Tax=Amycolatopsis taiwanensis TaxID=342230 RepID=UPI000486B98A|nr:hypothetical protein [Amycolatopsis taiwanensis]
MIGKYAMLGAGLIVGALAVAGCTSGAGATDGIAFDDTRKAAAGAGPSPATCPIPFDVPAALSGSQAVQPGKVEVCTSKTTSPAPDPLVAQRDQGMSALDAAAGVSIDCKYEVDGKTIDVWLVATPGGGLITQLLTTGVRNRERG